MHKVEKQTELQTIFTEGNNYYFDKNTPFGSIWGERGPETLAFLDKACKPGKKWADIPCGDGRYTQALLDRVGVVYACDIDGLGLMKTRELNTKDKDRDRLVPVQLNLTDTLPFQKESLDGVLTMGTLHLFHPHFHEHFYQDVDRVLKPGGNFIWNMPTNVRRKSLVDGSLIQFPGEYSQTMDEVLSLVFTTFGKYTIELVKPLRITNTYKDALPPYDWSADSVVFRVQKEQ